MRNRQAIISLAAVFLLMAVGYAGYNLGFLSFIYNVMIPETFGQYNMIILAAAFGVAAFFSPCAFTVLPAYVSNYLGKEEGKIRRARSIYLGILAALGIVTVNMVIGLFIGLLGIATPFAKDPRQDIPIVMGVRALTGLLIALLGVTSLFGKSISLHFVQKLFKGGMGKNIFAFGVFYNVAALGCTGPILLGLMLYAYASGSFSLAISAFGVFSLTMGILMVLLTMLTGVFKKAMVNNLMKISSPAKKLAAVVMIIAGISIFLLTLEGNNLFVKLFFPYLK